MRTQYKVSEELLEYYNDDKVLLWLDDRATSPKTIKGYLNTIKKYSLYLEKSPSDIFTEAEDEEDEMKMSRRHIKVYLIRFKKFLTDGGTFPDGTIQEPLAPKTVNQYISVIKSFYKFHDISIPNLNLKTAYKQIENEDQIEKADLINALEYANPSQKVVIYIGSSSGLPISDILNLKIGDVKNIDEYGITTVSIHRQKTNVPFTTFFSPEATEAIKEYLKYRNGYGTSPKKSYQEDWHEKRKVRSDDDYLIIAEQIGSKYLENFDEELRGVTTEIFIKNMRSLAQKSGVRLKPKFYSKLRTHVFRKYFFSTLINNECSDMVAKHMCGKIVGESDGTSYKPEIYKLKKQYMNYLPDLSLGNTQTKVITDKDYLELKKLHEDGVKQLRIESRIEILKLKLEMELKPYEDRIAVHQREIELVDRQIKSMNVQSGNVTKKDLKSVIHRQYGNIRNINDEMDEIKNKYSEQINELQEQLEAIEQNTS